MATTKKTQTKDEKKTTASQLRAFARWDDGGGADVTTVAARAVKEGEELRPPAGSGLPGSPAEKGGTVQRFDGATHREKGESEQDEKNERLVKKSPNPPKRLSRFARSTRTRAKDTGDQVEAELAGAKKAH